MRNIKSFKSIAVNILKTAISVVILIGLLIVWIFVSSLIVSILLVVFLVCGFWYLVSSVIDLKRPVNGQNPKPEGMVKPDPPPAPPPKKSTTMMVTEISKNRGW